MTRTRNRRGEGSKLREELIEAAAELIEQATTTQPVADVLSLRAVARAVGASPQAVYLHFEDKSELVAEVLGRRFRELDAVLDATTGLRERCLAYCAWGVERPGQYRLLFESRAELGHVGYEGSPGQATFTGLLRAVEPLVTGDAHAATTALWTSLHGIVSLRTAKPGFPWPPIEDLVDRAVAALA